MFKFKIGCDPEFFVKYGNKYKSAVGLIGGSKECPCPIDNDGSAILEDNVAVEFNTKPANSYEDFRDSIHKVLNHLREKLPGYEFSTESAVSFPKEELNTPQAQEFGCMPDYDAWRVCVNDKPHAEDSNLRSAGGHVHVGSSIAKKNPLEVIRAMDLFLGVPSVQLDTGTLRRNLYGKAGCFRPKPYGVEYRTLSNFWIFDDDLIKWVWTNTQRALKFVKDGHTIHPEHHFIIQRCINTSNHVDRVFLENTYLL